MNFPVLVSFFKFYINLCIFVIFSSTGHAIYPSFSLIYADKHVEYRCVGNAIGEAMANEELPSLSLVLVATSAYIFFSRVSIDDFLVYLERTRVSSSGPWNIFYY